LGNPYQGNGKIGVKVLVVTDTQPPQTQPSLSDHPYHYPVHDLRNGGKVNGENRGDFFFFFFSPKSSMAGSQESKKKKKKRNEKERGV
jgi:hypothetical protein